jgi:hypothetical protein
MDEKDLQIDYGTQFQGNREPVLINILTRTSGRPNGFRKCRKSIENQTYKNIRHIVCYDSSEDLNYLGEFNLDYFKVKRKKRWKFFGLRKTKPGYKPYNLYCNQLLKRVKEGWILFLDDDDMLLHNEVINEIVTVIDQINKDTLLIWKTRYPDGRLLPGVDVFDNEEISYTNIDTACFAFHSKFKSASKWDSYIGADFRFILGLSKVIPRQKWISVALTQKNNFGDHGGRNDIILP